jgi:DNA-binding XRE family transcriptional regulator
MSKSQLIKDYRAKHKLTQDNFAKLIGVSRRSVERWEMNIIEPGKLAWSIIYPTITGKQICPTCGKEI